MKKNVRKKDPNSTNSTGVLPLLLYHPCAQTSGVIIYSDGRTNRKMNSKSKIEIEQMLLGRDLRIQYLLILPSANIKDDISFCRCFMLLLSSSFQLQLFKTKSPKVASWPGILVSHKETRTKVVLARKLGKQGHGSSPDLNQKSRPPSDTIL